MRRAVIWALGAGMRINSAARMTGVSKPTILTLLRHLGSACIEYHHQHVQGLKLETIQTGEIGSFNFCKTKNVGCC